MMLELGREMDTMLDKIKKNLDSRDIRTLGSPKPEMLHLIALAWLSSFRFSKGNEIDWRSPRFKKIEAHSQDFDADTLHASSLY